MKFIEWPNSYTEKFNSKNSDFTDINDLRKKIFIKLGTKLEAYYVGALAKQHYELFLNTYLYGIGEKEAWKHFSISLNLEKDYLKLLLANGEKLTVNIYGENLTIHDPNINDGGILVQGWNNRLSKAVIARDQELIKILVEMPFEKVYNKSMKYEEYVFKYYEFLKALYTKGDETYPEKLKEAILYTFPDKLKWSRTEDPRFMLMQMKMYLFLLSGDEHELNQTIAEYLEASKAFILEIREGMQLYSDFIKIGVLEICSIAHDRGMKINVQSPYIPEWLYKGDFRNWK